MEYDPNEMFREDPGESGLSPEFNADLQLAQEAIQIEDTQLEEASTPTGGQPEQAPQPEVSTEPQQEEEGQGGLFGTGIGAGLTYFGQPLEETAKQVSERGSAPGQGLLDFGIDFINMIPGVNIPKPTEYEDEIAQSVRQISSVITPTLIGGTALKSAGTAANTRVGWSIGQNKFVQFVGDRGVEALTGLGVGLVSSEYEEDNATGTLKKAFPKTFDFIPDSMATLDSDSPDMKRQKNIREDIGLGFVTDLALGSVKFVDAVVGTTGALRKSNKLVGETPQARAWVNSAQPDTSDYSKAQRIWDQGENLDEQFREETLRTRTPFAELSEEQQEKVIKNYTDSNLFSETPEDVVTRSAIKQEEALDEMGMYGYSINPAMDQPIKGIHDMYDYTEIGIRTVDDFGVVGASVDVVRVAKNLDTVYGRLGNVISEPALKYSLNSGEAAQDIVLGLADQLRKAGRVGMEGNGWKVTFEDVIDLNFDIS